MATSLQNLGELADVRLRESVKIRQEELLRERIAKRQRQLQGDQFASTRLIDFLTQQGSINPADATNVTMQQTGPHIYMPADIEDFKDVEFGDVGHPAATTATPTAQALPPESPLGIPIGSPIGGPQMDSKDIRFESPIAPPVSTGTRSAQAERPIPEPKQIPVDVDITGSGEDFKPIDVSGVIQHPFGVPISTFDEAENFLKALVGGGLEGLTGLDVLDESFKEKYPIGVTVGELAGFLGSFTLAGRAVRFLGPAFRLLSPAAQRVVRMTIAGGSLESVQQGTRGLFGQDVNLGKIPETAILFGTTEAALMGIGKLGRTIFRKADAVLPEAMQIKLPDPRYLPKPKPLSAIEKEWQMRLPRKEPKPIINKLARQSSELIEPTISKNPFTLAKNWFNKWSQVISQDMLRRGFIQGRNLVNKTEAGKEIVIRGDRMLAKIGRREGQAGEVLRDAGLHKMNKNERELLTKVLESTDKKGAIDYTNFSAGEITPKIDRAARIVRKMLNFMSDHARGQKIRTGFLDRYVPRILKRNVAETIYGDLRRVMTQNGVIQGGDDIMKIGRSLSERQLSKAQRDALIGMTYSAETEAAIQSLIQSGGRTRLRAIMDLERVTGDELFMPFGNLERSRINDLPINFYERDSKKVLDRYIEGWSRRVSEAEEFGAQGQKAIRLLEGLAKESPERIRDAKDLVQTLLRITERSNAIQNPALKKTAEAYVNFRVATAIGLGFATVPNITQTLISTFAKHGLVRTTRGFGELFKESGRKAIRKSGAGWVEAHQIFAGIADARGPMSGFSRTTTILFNKVNQFNKALSAGTAKVAIPEYYAQAQGTGQIAKIAKRRLRDVGIDWDKPLTDDIVLEGMNRFANDAQLLRNVLDEPLWFNDPRWRTWALFKRFGYRQATFVKDQMLAEIAAGNPLPTLRLIAGGAAGGEFVVWAKNNIKEVMAGKNVYKEDSFIKDQTLGSALNVLSASGAFGIFSELSDIDPSDPKWKEYFYGNLAFQITPILASDILKMFDPKTGIIPTTIKSKDREEMKLFLSKVMREYGGSISRYSTQTLLETRDQRKRRLRRK